MCIILFIIRLEVWWPPVSSCSLSSTISPDSRPSSKTALWFTNICLKTIIADMENLGRHAEQVYVTSVNSYPLYQDIWGNTVNRRGWRRPSFAIRAVDDAIPLCQHIKTHVDTFSWTTTFGCKSYLLETIYTWYWTLRKWWTQWNQKSSQCAVFSSSKSMTTPKGIFMPMLTK